MLPAKPLKQTATGAGIIIYDDHSDGDCRRSMIMPYNEGRFSDPGRERSEPARRYVLPKGAVDAGETNFQAALRETQEETGVDPVRLLCKTSKEVAAYETDPLALPAAVTALMQGQEIEPFDSAGYPGVRVKHADVNPQIHDFTNRVGKELSVAMFGIEVENIEALKPHLKNPDKRTKLQEKIERETPKFATMLSWMQRGHIPAAEAGEAKYIQLKHTAQWFSDQVARYAPDAHLLDRDVWRKFCEDVQQDPKAIKTLWASCEEIKHHLLDKKKILGDNDVLKLDMRDCPLHFFVEGASIINDKDLIRKIFFRMDADPDYAAAFGGQCAANATKPPEYRITHSAAAAIGNFVAPEVIAKAFQEAEVVSQKRHQQALRWTGGLPEDQVVAAFHGGTVEAPQQKRLVA